MITDYKQKNKFVQESPSAIDLFRNWGLMKNSLLCSGIFNVVSYVYVGVIYSTADLHGNIYLN